MKTTTRSNSRASTNGASAGLESPNILRKIMHVNVSNGSNSINDSMSIGTDSRPLSPSGKNQWHHHWNTWFFGLENVDGWGVMRDFLSIPTLATDMLKRWALIPVVEYWCFCWFLHFQTHVFRQAGVLYNMCSGAHWSKPKK